MDTNFTRRFQNLPQDLWIKLTQIESLKGKWEGSTRLNPQILGRLKQSVLITSTGASTRIEGSRLTDEEIEKMLRGISIQKFQNRDSQEVRGYYELLQNVFNSWESLAFSEGLIKHFHQELLKYVDKFETTKAYLTLKEMAELVDWTKSSFQGKTYHPLLIIGNFLVEFLNIHPFTDGNGRLSRVLTNLLLLQQGYAYIPYISHEKLVEDNKPEYYLALRKSQKTLRTDNPDITAWLHFFLDMLLAQSQMAISLLTKQNIESILSPAQLMVWDYLQTAGEVTPLTIAKATQVPRPTINQVMNRLIKLKIVERVGLGATTRYRKL